MYGDNARPTICAEGFVELTRGITQRKEPFNGSDAQRATIGNNDVPLWRLLEGLGKWALSQRVVKLL